MMFELRLFKHPPLHFGFYLEGKMIIISDDFEV